MPYGTSYTRFQYNSYAGGRTPRAVERIKGGIVDHTFPSIVDAAKSLTPPKYGSYMRHLIKTQTVVDGCTYRFKVMN